LQEAGRLRTVEAPREASGEPAAGREE
jgi:hypothetical protein